MHMTIAPLLKFIFKVDYIIDFRDPWYPNNYRIFKNKIIKNIVKYIESLVVSNALLVINVTSYANETYKALYPNHSDKFFVIENGFDEDEFQVASNHILDKSNYICYSGKFSDFRNPKKFIEALSIYNKKNKEKNWISFMLAHLKLK